MAVPLCCNSPHVLRGNARLLQGLAARPPPRNRHSPPLRSCPLADLHRSSEAQARSLQATQKELTAAKEAAAALQAAQAELHEERGRLQAELAAAREQREEAVRQQEAAAAQQRSLQEKLATVEAALADNRQLAQQVQQQVQQAQDEQQEATAAAAELRQQLASAQQQLASAVGKEQEWCQQRGELQQQLAALQKAQSVADGKLVLARQREAQFKVGGGGMTGVQHSMAGWCSAPGLATLTPARLPPPCPLQEASKQLKVLQQELQAFAAEGHAHREKREEAEAR